ncbi:triokinase/FMN cyclase [Ooceraea biroi]|uniref:Triokinase/FMN cyclase n=1 Tax=Ooceraea biroi TaxID=2015173 RepID=A0A026WU04_OOCBI|nr:triokinase/FMN cyclase [Ooceraea biroi]EZA59458.1 Bifunctional ATP-dependent dihydroxyacetone kinase/FAD-AMP lyase (cyclizing) [Ooceraea biroi]
MAMSKNLINSLDDAVLETLSGLCYTYPQLEHRTSHRIVLSPDYRDRKNKVALICGGGSGHEPFAAGFVGRGMLTASIAGSIFAAPPSVHITRALQCVARYNEAGILVVVPNYTGDCLNFGIAVEKAQQAGGIKVEEIIVGDDCSIPENEESVAGKRGLVGMLFVIKIAGAFAEREFPLYKVTKIAQHVSQNTATYGIGLSACTVPGQGLMFELTCDEIECGMGVHGEAGYERIKLKTASELVTLMLKRICETLRLVANDTVAVIVNNFGALSQLEQGIVVHEVVNQLRKMNIEPIRVYSGTLMTSLNSAGVHVSVLKLTESHRDIFVKCLDDETMAPCWPGGSYSIPSNVGYTSSKDNNEKEKVKKIGISLNIREQHMMKLCLKNACTAIIEKEGYLNELDRGCGDGDCGSTLKRLADNILNNLDNLSLSHPVALLSEIANIAEEQMGGTSGALYCLFFTTGAKELALLDQKKDLRYIWYCAFLSGLKCLEKYGKAKAGDRTMIDTMYATCITYEKLLNEDWNNFYDQITTAAWEGCDSTKNMKPKAGRASYIKQTRYLTEVDAGAYAAATWIAAIARTIMHFTE